MLQADDYRKKQSAIKEEILKFEFVYVVLCKNGGL